MLYISVGHGLSDGDRVHVDNFMTYVDDVIQHCQMVREEFPDLPLFMYGHSMVNCSVVKPYHRVFRFGLGLGL